MVRFEPVNTLQQDLFLLAKGQYDAVVEAPEQRLDRLYRTFGATEIELTIHDDLICTSDDGERFVPPPEMIAAAQTGDMTIFEPHRTAFQASIDEHFTGKYGAPKDKTSH